VVTEGPPSTGKSETVAVVRYEANRHLSALTTFYRDIWDPAATEQSVACARAEGAARNPVAPGAEAPTFLFLKGDTILGHLSTIPVQLWTGSAQRPAFWFIGFMVRPEHRNGPVGALLLREAVKQLELTLSLTVALPSVRLFRAVGFTDLGLVPNAIRILRAGRVLRRLDLAAVGIDGLPRLVRAAIDVARRPVLAPVAGAMGQLGLDALAFARSWWPAGTASANEGKAGSADSLWAEARTGMGLVAARDEAYLARRYDVTGPYRAVSLHEAGRLSGVAYVREPRAEGDARLRGIKVATLSDIVFPPDKPGLGLRLLRGAERVARELGADALLASQSHRAIRPLLRRRGYVGAGGNLRFLVRDARGELPGATVLEDWWVSRGDMNADSVF
jgi:GNAT superfamily N-acetyltransferase